MKIILILPRAGIYRFGTGAFSRFIRYSPMTLPVLAALVPQDLNAEIEVFDEGVDRIFPERLRADIIGITGITGASRRTYAYADYFRRKGMYVVIGGVHASLMTDEASFHADTVITGHAFETWPQFLRDYSQGRPQKRYSPPPYTDFSHFKVPVRNFMKRKPFVTINSTQAVFGCPNGCEFCVTPVVCKRYEMRPIKQVVDEISCMKGRYLTFVDPSPIENVEYATALYTAMIPLHKRWTGLATTRLVKHRELMDAMEMSGCRGLLIGFESLAQRTNDSINKKFNTVADYYRLAAELHHRGIAIMGCFVHGLDGDTTDCFDTTLEFVLKAKIDLPRFTICTPFPGTPYFTRLKNEARILTENWALYDAQHVVFRPSNMTVEELIAGHHRIWKQAYRVNHMMSRLIANRCFLRYAVPANLGYKLYANNLHRFGPDAMDDDHTDGIPQMELMDARGNEPPPQVDAVPVLREGN
jgi:radical SAM superfamily enzyme YgiQ (UPF0313 family)